MYKVLAKTLRSSQAIFALEAGCDEIRGPYTLGGLLHPLHGSLRPEHCLKGIERSARFLKQRAKGTYQGPALRWNDREPWIAGDLLEKRR